MSPEALRAANVPAYAAALRGSASRLYVRVSVALCTTIARWSSAVGESGAAVRDRSTADAAPLRLTGRAFDALCPVGTAGLRARTGVLGFDCVESESTAESGLNSGATVAGLRALFHRARGAVPLPSAFWALPLGRPQADMLPTRCAVCAVAPRVAGCKSAPLAVSQLPAAAGFEASNQQI